MITNIEQLTRDFFKELYPNEVVEYNYRPDWLKNQQTGRNLEIDIFYGPMRLAIEVNGIFHKKLRVVKTRDKFKKRRCKKRNIFYLEVLGVQDLYDFKSSFFKDFSLSEEMDLKLKSYKPNKVIFSSLVKIAVSKEIKKSMSNRMHVSAKKEVRSNLERLFRRGVYSEQEYKKRLLLI